MGTQFQSLTTACTWVGESEQKYWACNLEHQHVFSQAWLHFPGGFQRSTRIVAHRVVWPWKPKTNPDQHPPLCPQLSLPGRQMQCCGFSAWSLLGPNPNPTPNQNPQPKPNLISKPNPASEPPSGMGPHFSPRGRSQDWSRFGPGDVLDQTLILAQTLFQWRPKEQTINHL